MSYKILHISDLHFGPLLREGLPERIIDFSKSLEPQLIVNSGDFTQRAKKREFARAKSFMDELPKIPTINVPGNHDVPLYRVWERVFAPYRNYERAIGPSTDRVYEDDQVKVVALNSTAPLRKITNGVIDSEQIEFCQNQFRSSREKTKIVVAHHHFAAAPDYEHTEIASNAKRALKAFSELEVDLILGGHLHRSYIGNSLDVLPEVDSELGVVIVQCGTSASSRGRAREKMKNSLNVIEIESSGLSVVHYVYHDERSEFFPLSKHSFLRTPPPPSTDLGTTPSP